MKKNKFEKIALERIYRLFELAEQNFGKRPDRSKRYVGLARKIGTRTNTRIPQELKPRFCKKCNAFLVDHKNATLQTSGTFLIVKCLECGFERKTRHSKI